MKILITADWHFGVPKKLNYSLWGAGVIRDYAIDNKIHDVVILGDLFHDRVNLNIEIAHKVYEFFENLRERRSTLAWHVFPGNHDMYLKHSWGILSLKPLSGLMHLHMEGKATIGDMDFWIIPFVYDEESYMNHVHDVEKKAKKDDILLTHVGVCGASLNECFLIKNWNIVDFKKTKFKRVFAGHFHCQQQVGKVWYPGSPVAFRFDEGTTPHGFLVYDTANDTVEFVDAFEWAENKTILDRLGPGGEPIPRPPLYYTVLDEDLKKKPAEFFKDNLVRVVLTKDYTRDEALRLEKELREQGVTGVSWMKPKEKDVEIEVAQKGEVDMKAPGQLLELWIKKDGAEGLNKQLLKKLNEHIISEAEERVIVEGDDQ